MVAKNIFKKHVGEWIKIYGVYAGSQNGSRGKKHMNFRHIIDNEGRTVVATSEFESVENEAKRNPKLNEWVRLEAKVELDHGTPNLTCATIEEIVSKKEKPIAAYLKQIAKTKGAFKLDWKVDEDTAKKLNRIIPPNEHHSFDLYFRRPIPINGTVQRETAKALLIKFENGTEAWIPKSTIHSKFSPQNKRLQPFLIQSWVLDKKNAVT